MQASRCAMVYSRKTKRLRRNLLKILKNIRPEAKTGGAELDNLHVPRSMCLQRMASSRDAAVRSTK